MKKIIIDTETNGLPSNYNDLYTYKNIVQISFMVIGVDNEEVARGNFIIKQDEDISKESSKIHGITNEIAESKGLDFFEVMGVILPFIDRIDAIIGHNIKFDLASIKSMYLRNNKDVPEIEKIVIDTMIVGSELGIFTGANNLPKWPKLSELYKHFFEEEFEDQHNSMGDVIATCKCFLELEKMGKIKNIDK